MAYSPAANVAIASGTVINYNTIEEFKDSNKKALFAQTADQVWPIATPPISYAYLLVDLGVF